MISALWFTSQMKNMQMKILTLAYGMTYTFNLSSQQIILNFIASNDTKFLVQDTYYKA